MNSQMVNQNQMSQLLGRINAGPGGGAVGGGTGGGAMNHQMNPNGMPQMNPNGPGSNVGAQQQQQQQLQQQMGGPNVMNPQMPINQSQMGPNQMAGSGI